VTYNLPSPESNKIAHAALSGWSVDSFIFARTAPPVMDVLSGIVFADGIALYPRPNVNPGVPLVHYGSQYAGGRIFNSAAFTAPPAGQQGNFGRNVLRGFGAWHAIWRCSGNFTSPRRWGFVSAQSSSTSSTTQMGNPNNNLTSPLFGHSTQTLASSLWSGGANGGFNPLYQIGGPRSIQLALKLQF
jgi:hypothetical protein